MFQTKALFFSFFKNCNKNKSLKRPIGSGGFQLSLVLPHTFTSEHVWVLQFLYKSNDVQTLVQSLIYFKKQILNVF